MLTLNVHGHSFSLPWEEDLHRREGTEENRGRDRGERNIGVKKNNKIKTYLHN